MINLLTSSLLKSVVLIDRICCGSIFVALMGSPPPWIYILDENRFQKSYIFENQHIHKITPQRISKKPTNHVSWPPLNLDDSTVPVKTYFLDHFLLVFHYQINKPWYVSDSASSPLSCPCLWAPWRQCSGVTACQELHHVEPWGQNPRAGSTERLHPEPPLCLWWYAFIWFTEYISNWKK